MTAQQDSDEFLLRIFDGIQNSYDPQWVHLRSKSKALGSSHIDFEQYHSWSSASSWIWLTFPRQDSWSPHLRWLWCHSIWRRQWDAGN
jgi:hypothetical protein